MTDTNTPSSLKLDLTPKKQTRRGQYDQATLDALCDEFKKIPDEMTPEMEEQLKRHEEKLAMANNLEYQLINHQLTTHNERVKLYKTTGAMVEEDGGDKIPTHLTAEEKNAIPVLQESDITDIEKHERALKTGEKYHILTYKKQGEQYTAIQVPEQIKKMKYKDTHLGKELMKFKDNDRYPAFLTADKLDSAIDKEWLIQKSSPAYESDGKTPKVSINLYNDGDLKGDIIREVAKKGGKMMTITDNIIMTELIKQTLGEEYISSDFCGNNFDSESEDEKQKILQKQLQEIEEMFLVHYPVNKKDYKGYINRDYGIYKQQKSYNRTVGSRTKKEYYAGYLRGYFHSAFSALGGVGSVFLNGALVDSYSGIGFRPCG